MTVFAFLTDVIAVDFVVNMATKFTNVMVVSVVTGVRCLQWFCVSLCRHFLSLSLNVINLSSAVMVTDGICRNLRVV